MEPAQRIVATAEALDAIERLTVGCHEAPAK
jgi:hypothetical protein